MGARRGRRPLHTLPHHVLDFQLFVGIYLLIIQQVQIVVLNLKELHQQVLRLLGPPYEALYS